MVTVAEIYTRRSCTELTALLRSFCKEQGLEFGPADDLPYEHLDWGARHWLGAFILRERVMLIEEEKRAAFMALPETRN